MAAILAARIARSSLGLTLRINGRAVPVRVPLLFLWDHTPAALHPSSKQRSLDVSKLADPAALSAKSMTHSSEGVRIEWSDGLVGDYPSSFFTTHLPAIVGKSQLSPRFGLRPPQLWTQLSPIPSVASEEALKQPRAVLENLAVRGVCLITNMPLSLQDTESVLTRIVGPPRETFYGRMWDTAPKADVNDTAYTNLGLDPHTDCTYLDDTPGLQCFNCVAQAGEGGSTIIVDGYQVVAELKEKYPATYAFFCSTPLAFHHIEQGVNVRASRRVIELDPFDRNAPPVQFRFNVYDLAPITYFPLQKLKAVYKHLSILGKLLRDERLTTELKLEVGQCLIVDNRRVLHGRRAFSGYRNLVGCYVGADDWTLRLRARA